MVRVEAEVPASASGFPLDSGGQYRPLLMTRISRKGIALSDFISIVNWMDGLIMIEVDEKIM
jgi:hypothetical protein